MIRLFKSEFSADGDRAGEWGFDVIGQQNLPWFVGLAAFTYDSFCCGRGGVVSLGANEFTAACNRRVVSVVFDVQTVTAQIWGTKVFAGYTFGGFTNNPRASIMTYVTLLGYIQYSWCGKIQWQR